jgi:hypothetical protein
MHAHSKLTELGDVRFYC